jgi:hypothetical protein
LRDALTVAVHVPEIELSEGVAFVGRLSKPARRSRVILADTLAVGVHATEIELSGGVALVGRLLIPAHRSRVILADTLAVGVHQPEIRLSGGVALVGRLSKPACRGRVILRDAMTFAVHDPETELSVGVALLGRWTDKTERGCVVVPLVSGQTVLNQPGGGCRTTNAHRLSFYLVITAPALCLNNRAHHRWIVGLEITHWRPISQAIGIALAVPFKERLRYH